MKYKKGQKFKYFKTMNDKAFYNCILYYRNEARWRYQKAKNSFIRGELAKLNADNMEDLERKQRQEIEKKMNVDPVCEALRISYDGWKILYNHLERKEITDYDYEGN